MVEKFFQALNNVSSKRKPTSSFYENTRRMISLFPGLETATEQVQITSRNDIRRQLLKLEADGVTCSLKMESREYQSRAALIMVDGKIVCCVYNDKFRARQLFGKMAYDKVLSQMTHLGNVFEVYVIPRDVALAASALFCDVDNLVTTSFSEAIEMQKQASAHGTVALFDHVGLPLCVLYFYAGKIVGTRSFSFKNCLFNVQAISEYLEEHPQTSVMSAVLQQQDFKRSQSIMLSPLGLQRVVER